MRYLLGAGTKGKSSSYRYATRMFSNLTKEEVDECSDLYSNHYGIYNNEASDNKRGNRIKLSTSHYQVTYANYPTTSISTCRTKDNKLVGFAIFIKGAIADGRKFCWVTQLVVHHGYRKRGIGTKLLESAWCFSDYAIRGLATANAITLRTLENVTWREIDKEEVKNREGEVRQILNAVPYMANRAIVVNQTSCQVDSEFFPEPERIDATIQKKYDAKLGCILRGHEWLGVIFNDQPVQYDAARFADYMLFSEGNVFDAYARMLPGTQGWNKGAREEVMTIIKMLTPLSKDVSILDIGCGTGRHCIEFAKQGYTNVIGIDMLPNFIEYARLSAEAENVPITFLQGDVRNYKRKQKRYDVVLCLYDVIGTYRYEWDNDMILANIRQHLRIDGVAIISVMNMNLTEYIVGNNKFSIQKYPERLLDLPATGAMQKSGNVFHKDMIINTDDGLVYRKEQFRDDNGLDAEYVIADKRYTEEEFTEKLNAYGFEVLETRYVRAGAWRYRLDRYDVDAKEILFVARKKRMWFEW